MIVQLIWSQTGGDALARMDEVNRAVRSGHNRIQARQVLRAEPFGYSVVVATHILDLSVSRQRVTGIEELRRERSKGADLLRSLEWRLGSGALEYPPVQFGRHATYWTDGTGAPLGGLHIGT
jgi:DNA gyrase/topoisomerase IV subunit A